MAVNFNSAFYHNDKVERVINPKTTGVDGKVLDKKPPIEQAARIEQYQNQQVVRSDNDAIALLDQQYQAKQDQVKQDRSQQNNQQQAIYDKPNRNAAKALNAYQSVADDDKRQAFAALVGVDIFV